MQYKLKNNSSSTILLAGYVEIVAGDFLIIYDNITNISNISIDMIILSTASGFANPSYNLNYCFDNSLITYYENSTLKTTKDFYTFFNDFKLCVADLEKYKADGLIDLKLDFENRQIIIGNIPIRVSDLPSNIPAT